MVEHQANSLPLTREGVSQSHKLHRLFHMFTVCWHNFEEKEEVPHGPYTPGDRIEHRVWHSDRCCGCGDVRRWYYD